MKKNCIPPQNAQDELLKTLNRRYPELEEKTDIFRSISYTPGTSPNSIYGATVSYHFEKGSATALFEYQKSAQDYYWYCSRDWND